jgi:hypothetical protein
VCVQGWGRGGGGRGKGRMNGKWEERQKAQSGGVRGEGRTCMLVVAWVGICSHIAVSEPSRTWPSLVPHSI